MALFQFLVICSVIMYTSCAIVGSDVPDMKPNMPVFDFKKTCFEKFSNARSNKIICLICTGFDLSCFDSKPGASTAGASTTPTTTTTKGVEVSDAD